AHRKRRWASLALDPPSRRCRGRCLTGTRGDSMETVNFQCGHCQQLLAVNKDHLGQQVRCPHCQQVVVAPLPSPPAAAAPPFPDSVEPTYQYTTSEDQDSIFSAPAESEDLFGAQ